MKWLNRLRLPKRRETSPLGHREVRAPIRPPKDELRRRILADVGFYRSVLPERVAIAWRGYLAALLEWSVIEVHEHDRLLRLLPPIDNDPVNDIMTGRHPDESDEPVEAATQQGD